MTAKCMFGNDRASVTGARRFAADVLYGHTAETLESVELMVSELASNCVRHTDSEFEIEIGVGSGTIRIAATDWGHGQPVMRTATPTDLSGRGLMIIDMLSAEWGVELGGGPGLEKTVWFTLAAEAPVRVSGQTPETTRS